MIEINPESPEPIYVQIVDQVRLAVAVGRLKPADRLEPIRDLARRLAVNASTVARAYRVLEQQGVIDAHGRGGTTVAEIPFGTALKAIREERLRTLFDGPLTAALVEGFEPEEIEAAIALQLAVWRTRRLTSDSPGGRPDTQARLRRFAGSHDLAMETLWAHARRAHPDDSIEAKYVGSLDGLLALLHGSVGLAGAHLLDEESGEYNLPILRRLFVGQRLCVVSLAERQQGLIVPRGNPKDLRTFAHLARPDVRIINRQPGSGTRTLLDFHLHKLGIAADSINGYDRQVATHLAVAQAVANSQADVGLGLLAAARAYNLGYVPLATERYDLVLMAQDRTSPPLTWLLDLVKSPEFRAVVAQLGGYDTRCTGQEIYLG